MSRLPSDGLTSAARGLCLSASSRLTFGGLSANALLHRHAYPRDKVFTRKTEPIMRRSASARAAFEQVKERQSGTCMGKRISLIHGGTAIALALALTISNAGSAHAGTNFPAVKDYPSPNCAKPSRPPALAAGSGKAVDAYNRKIGEYNAAQLAYATCINVYVASAQADLDLVRSKASKTVPNFPALKDYPAPDCGEPVNQPAPLAPAENDTLAAANRRAKDYNAQIAKYNVYVSCLNAYSANAQADMDLIRDKVNKAVAENKTTQ